jgi:hypothetical protein
LEVEKKVKVRGLPHLAKNERDMGHPTILGREKGKPTICGRDKPWRYFGRDAAAANGVAA